MNNHHNNEKDLETRLTCDSAFIMEKSGGTSTSSLFISMGPTSLTASILLSTFTVSMFCCKIINER
jgi:hypothetical protein